MLDCFADSLIEVPSSKTRYIRESEVVCVICVVNLDCLELRNGRLLAIVVASSRVG